MLKFIKKTLKSLFDVNRWMSGDTIKGQWRSLKNANRDLFEIKAVVADDSFAQALRAQNLQESDLPRLIQQYGWISFFFFSLCVLQGCYIGYLAYLGAWDSVFIALVVASFSSVLAFRYHYWRFLLQQKTLGLGVGAWLWSMLSWLKPKHRE